MYFYALEILSPGKMTNLIFGLYSYEINNIYLSRTKITVSNIVFTVICQIGMNFESYCISMFTIQTRFGISKKNSAIFYSMIFRFITCAVNIKKKKIEEA